MLMTTQPKPITSQGIRIGTLLCLLLAILVCNGCLTRPALRRENFAFQNPPPPQTPPTSGIIIAVNSVDVSPLFDKNSFTYRTGPVSYESDPYAGFMVPPDQAIAIAMRAHLVASGKFRNVIEPGGMLNGSQSVEAYVSELYGDFSQPGKGVAVLSMRISVYDPRFGRSPIMQKDYSERVPVQKNTAADVMAGWNTALDQIMTEFTSDLPR
jgi:hypothetical protein